jgi:hypothetical protein
VDTPADGEKMDSHLRQEPIHAANICLISAGKNDLRLARSGNIQSRISFPGHGFFVIGAPKCGPGILPFLHVS